MKVLFATDGFAPARAAEALIRKMGDRGSIEVTVLSVASYEFLIPERADVMTEAMEQRQEQAARVVAGAVARFEKDGFRASGRTAEGSPGRTIIEQLEDGDHDLVIVGGGSHSRLHHAFLGSTSMTVLHASPTAVLVVHEAAPSERPRILVATDGSPDASAAASLIAKLADPKVCEVTVLSVIPVPAAGPIVGFPIPVYPIGLEEAQERATAELTERAERYATETANGLRARGFGTATRILEGHPTELLLKEIESEHYDVVVVGSRGQGTLKRIFLGSVSDAVARHAHAALVARRLLP